MLASPGPHWNAPMDFDAARRHMIDSQVRPNGVNDPRVIAAIDKTPREAFFPSGFKHLAYADTEVAYGDGRSLIKPRDFAKLLAALDPRPSDLALDIASGTGYAAAVLARLVDVVIGVEHDAELIEAAQEKWAELGVDRAVMIETEPAGGAPAEGPFDIVLIAQAVEIVPQALLDQLKDGGRLGAIVASGRLSKGLIYTRSGRAVSGRESFDASARVVLPGFERPKSFIF